MNNAITTDTREQTIRRFWDLTHAHRFDELDSVLHPDVERIVLWYGGPDTMRGSDAYVAHLRSRIPTFARWEVTIRSIVLAEDPTLAYMRCSEVLDTAEGRHREIEELFEYEFAPDGRLLKIDFFFKVDPAMAASVLERFPLSDS